MFYSIVLEKVLIFALDKQGDAGCNFFPLRLLLRNRSTLDKIKNYLLTIYISSHHLHEHN